VPANYIQLVVARASMTRFVMFDNADRDPDGLAQLAGWLRSGKLRSQEDVLHGDVNDFPDVLLRLFNGENTGKAHSCPEHRPIGAAPNTLSRSRVERTTMTARNESSPFRGLICRVGYRRVGFLG
jgi:hypothetical protein